MGKKEFVIVLIFILFVSSFNVVSSKNFYSEKINLDSGKRLSNVFENFSYTTYLIEQENFSKVKIENEETWVKIKINLKSSPEFEIVEGMNLDKDSMEEFIKKRRLSFKSKISGTLKDLLDKNMQLVRFSPEGFIVWVNEEGLEKVINNPDIERITYSNIKIMPFLRESIPIVNADDAWSSGYTGDNLKVCVVDSGVDSSNSYVYGNIVDEYCYCDPNILPGGCCPNGQEEDDDAEDEIGHGTAVIGVIVSNDGNYTGIAPDADIYIVKVAGEEGDMCLVGNLYENSEL